MPDCNADVDRLNLNLARTRHALSKRVTTLFIFDSSPHVMPRNRWVPGSRSKVQLGSTPLGLRWIQCTSDVGWEDLVELREQVGA